MNSYVFTIGSYQLSRTLLEDQKRKRRRLDLNIIGVIVIAPDVTPELVEAAVGRVKLRGTVRGNAPATRALKAKIQ